MYVERKGDKWKNENLIYTKTKNPRLLNLYIPLVHNNLEVSAEFCRYSINFLEFWNFCGIVARSFTEFLSGVQLGYDFDKMRKKVLKWSKRPQKQARTSIIKNWALSYQKQTAPNAWITDIHHTFLKMSSNVTEIFQSLADVSGNHAGYVSKELNRINYLSKIHQLGLKKERYVDMCKKKAHTHSKQDCECENKISKLLLSK